MDPLEKSPDPLDRALCPFRDVFLDEFQARGETLPPELATTADVTELLRVRSPLSNQRGEVCLIEEEIAVHLLAIPYKSPSRFQGGFSRRRVRDGETITSRDPFEENYILLRDPASRASLEGIAEFFQPPIPNTKFI